jgi:hypothetical protein
MTLQDSLSSLLDNECLLLHCDWLGSDLRISHIFIFRCPLLNTPHLNTQLLKLLWLNYESMSYSFSVIMSVSVATGVPVYLATCYLATEVLLLTA